jgi:pyruvate dehydrogenase E1 component alpha subunit
MHGHGAHDDMRYVPSELLEEWTAKDPITRYEAVLAEAGIATADLHEAVAAQVDEAVTAALASPMPDPASAVRGVFAESEPEPLGEGSAPYSAFAAGGQA